MDILQLIIGSGGLIGVFILIFRTGRIVEKVDSIDKSLIELKNEFKEVKKSIHSIEVQIGKLETRVEERTLRVIHNEIQKVSP